MIMKEKRIFIDVCDIQKDVLKCRNDVAGLYSTNCRGRSASCLCFGAYKPRACHFSDDVRALPYRREFVCTLLDLAKDQISDGESAAANIVVVIAT